MRTIKIEVGFDLACGMKKHTYYYFLLINSCNLLNYLLLSKCLLSFWCLQTINLQFFYLLSFFYCHFQSVRKFGRSCLSRIARILFFSSLALAFIASSLNYSSCFLFPVQKTLVIDACFEHWTPWEIPVCSNHTYISRDNFVPTIKQGTGSLF